MKELSFIKIRRRLWGDIVRFSRNKFYYLYLYRSYWNFLLRKGGKLDSNNFYFSARPNPGAGIGHQMANWIAGYWFAKQFKIRFAHIPFSSVKWENFLGFGAQEVLVDTLTKEGYKKVRLPLFDENKPEEIELIKKIISSYSGQKIVFVCEQDQFYKNQYGILEDIQNKFYQAESRKNDQLIYDTHHYNIAIHIRRGDIVIGQENKNPNLLMRYQDNDYFYNTLSYTLKEIVKTDKKIVIHLFSQGIEKDFEEFKDFPNVQFCLDMNAQDSFLHMVYADCLITSKSSFSYKPALLNKGIKVCPKDFWHGYPNTKNWVLID